MKAERVGSLFWLAVGLISIYGSVKLGLGTLREPSSGFLPLLSGCFISVTAMIVFFRSFLRRREVLGSLSGLWQGLRWRCPIEIILLMLGYVLALERLGFLLSTFLLLFIIFKGVEKFSLGKAILIPVVTLGVSYMLLNVFLKVTLPKGVFGF